LEPTFAQAPLKICSPCAKRLRALNSTHAATPTSLFPTRKHGPDLEDINPFEQKTRWNRLLSGIRRDLGNLVPNQERMPLDRTLVYLQYLS